jgi:hypothetical protein
MATIPVFAAFDMQQNQIHNSVLDNVAVLPLAPVLGQEVMLTTAVPPTAFVWNGTAWVSSTPAAGVGKFSVAVGPGVGPFTVVHNLGTLNTVESVYSIATGIEIVSVVTHTTANSTTFAIVPALLTPAQVTIIG